MKDDDKSWARRCWEQWGQHDDNWSLPNYQRKLLTLKAIICGCLGLSDGEFGDDALVIAYGPISQYTSMDHAGPAQSWEELSVDLGFAPSTWKIHTYENGN